MRAGNVSSLETSEFLLAALEQANDAVVVVDGKHKVIHFNAAAERMWGIARAEIIGRDANPWGSIWTAIGTA